MQRRVYNVPIEMLLPKRLMLQYTTSHTRRVKYVVYAQEGFMVIDEDINAGLSGDMPTTTTAYCFLSILISERDF